MNKKRGSSSYGRDYPSEFRRSVSGDDQFQLSIPPRLVPEIGFEDYKRDVSVMWYLHEEEDKIMLANKKGKQRSSLKMLTGSKMYGVSVEDLRSGSTSSGRVTIVNAIPDRLYELLTQSDRVVLKPLYADKYAELEATCVSVFPEDQYDTGAHPNVDQSTSIDDDNTVRVEHNFSDTA
jgi:hypothetical protein